MPRIYIDLTEDEVSHFNRTGETSSTFRRLKTSVITKIREAIEGLTDLGRIAGKYQEEELIANLSNAVKALPGVADFRSSTSNSTGNNESLDYIVFNEDHTHAVFLDNFPGLAEALCTILNAQQRLLDMLNERDDMIHSLFTDSSDARDKVLNNQRVEIAAWLDKWGDKWEDKIDGKPMLALRAAAFHDAATELLRKSSLPSDPPSLARRECERLRQEVSKLKSQVEELRGSYYPS